MSRPTGIGEPPAYLFGRIAECSTYTSFASDVLNSVADYLGASSIVFLEARHTQGNVLEIERSTPVGVDIDLHDQYTEHYFRQDPVCDYVVSNTNRPDRLTPTEVFRLSDICIRRSLLDSEYYNRFLRLTGIGDILIVAARPHELADTTAIIGFHRQSRDPRFGAAALSKAKLVAPILGSTASRLILRNKLSQQSMLTADLEGCLGETGVVVLNDELEIIYETASQQANLGEAKGVLYERIFDACRRLADSDQENVRFALNSDPADRTAFGSSSRVVVIGRRRMGQGRSRFVASISPSQPKFAISECALEWNWTTREKQIAEQIASGLKNPQIAKKLNISIRTVENHLRSVYAKACVESRAQLLCKLASK